MRIGIDATVIFSPKPSGLGVYAINIINALFQLHQDIVVWTIDDSKLCIDSEKVRSVLRHFHCLGNRLYPLRAIWSEAILPTEIRRERIDLLFTVVPSGLSSAKIPHVMTVHDLIPLFYPSDVPLPVHLNYKYHVKQTIRSASSLFAVSEHTKHDITSFTDIPTERISVVYPGYDKSFFYPRKYSRVVESYGVEWGKYIFYVGNSSPRKNLTRLIRAFNRISSLIPHKLLIAGTRNLHEDKKLREQLKILGLLDRVVLIDYVPYNELPDLYSGADIFAYVSLYEGFGLPMIEAMACGTPVIASNSTSLPEVAGNAALLVSAESEEDIARGMLEVTSDRELRSKLVQRGFNRITTYSWDAAAKKMLDKFYNVMSQGCHPN